MFAMSRLLRPLAVRHTASTGAAGANDAAGRDPYSRGDVVFQKLLSAVGLAKPTPARARAVEIGWFLDTDKAGFIWEEPKRVKRDDPTPTHAKSVN
jgi:hypothetical protein